MERKALAGLIVARLQANEAAIAAHYAQHRYFVVDELLPAEVARQIHRSFPDPKGMMLRSSIRELKYVTSQMNQCPAIVEEAVYAFQEPNVVGEVERITRLRQVEP